MQLLIDSSDACQLEEVFSFTDNLRKKGIYTTNRRNLFQPYFDKSLRNPMVAQLGSIASGVVLDIDKD